jgi:WD40 repeat protein
LDIWDLSSGTHCLSVAKELSYINTIAFSPDSKLLFVKSNYPTTHLKGWETTTGTLRTDRELDSWFHNDDWMRFTPDGRYLLTEGLYDGPAPIIFWTIDTFQEAARIGDALAPIQFGPDGKQFVTFHRVPDSNTIKVRLWEIQDGPAPLRLLLEREIFAKQFAVSPNLEIVALANPVLDTPDTSLIQLLHIATGKVVSQVTAPPDAENQIQFLVFSPTGRFLVASYDNSFRPRFRQDYYLRDSRRKGRYIVWDVHTDLNVVPVASEAHISPDDRWILSWNGTRADLWDVDQRRSHINLRRSVDQPQPLLPFGIYNDEPGPFADCIFSPDGRFVIVTGFHVTTTPDFIQTILSGQWGNFNTPQTYPVATLWDVDRGKEITSFPECERAYFSPDGRTLATVQSDNTIRLYAMPPPSRAGLILLLTTITWTLTLLLCWAIKRLVRRWRRPAAASVRQV